MDHDWEKMTAHLLGAAEWEAATAHLVNGRRPRNRRPKRTITFVGGARYESYGRPSPSVQAKCDQYAAALRNEPLAQVSNFAMRVLMNRARTTALKDAMATDNDPLLTRTRAVLDAADTITSALSKRIR